LTELLSIPDFAKLTGLKYANARQLVLRGDIPHVRCGARRRIDRRWVEGWLSDSRRDLADKAHLVAEVRAAVILLDDLAAMHPERAELCRITALRLCDHAAPVLS